MSKVPATQHEDLLTLNTQLKVEQVIFRNRHIHTHAYMQQLVKNKAMNLKEIREAYIGGSGLYTIISKLNFEECLKNKMGVMTASVISVLTK